MKVALAHDYLNQYGGAERVLEQLHDLYPDAPIYTSMYDPSVMPAAYRSWDIRTSFMQQAAVRHEAPPGVPDGLPDRLRVVRPERLRRGDLEQQRVLQGRRDRAEHAPHQLLPDADALGLALPRLCRPGAAWGRCPDAAAAADPLPAGLGRDGVLAGGPVRRDLERRGGPDQEVLPPRLGDHLPASRHGPVPASRARPATTT